MIFLVVLGLALLGGMVYLAISHKSDLKIRIASLCALGLMVVSVIVCLLLYFKVRTTPTQLMLPDMDVSDLPPPPATNSLHMTIMFIILLIALFVMVIVFSLKEQAKISGKKDDIEEETGWE